MRLFWGEYQKWERHFIEISTTFYTFWCKNDYSTIFLSKVTKCWTSPCTISCKTILQRYGLSKIEIYVYFYGQSRSKCFITSSLLYFHWEKRLWLLCLVWWIFIHEQYIKNDKFRPWLILWPLPQNQFYHKEPHLVMLGHV